MTAASLQVTDPAVDALAQDVSPWGSARQRAAQRRNKRTALLATAARLFKRQGFASTSLDQMAAQLGITKPTLYYYVRSKSELVHTCAMQGWAHALESVQRVLQSSGPDRFARALKAYANAVATDFGWCMVRVGEYAQEQALHKEIGQQRQLLEQCLAAASTSELPVPVLLRALEGVVLALPKAQWPSAITVLGAGTVALPAAAPAVLVDAADVVDSHVPEIVVPTLDALAQTAVQPEPEPEPEPEPAFEDLNVLINQWDAVVMPTARTVTKPLVKKHAKPGKATAQISLF